jgi:hypothetical protein
MKFAPQKICHPERSPPQRTQSKDLRLPFAQEKELVRRFITVCSLRPTLVREATIAHGSDQPLFLNYIVPSCDPLPLPPKISPTFVPARTCQTQFPHTTLPRHRFLRDMGRNSPSTPPSHCANSSCINPRSWRGTIQRLNGWAARILGCPIHSAFFAEWVG